MNDGEMASAARLRQRAARCRHEARQVQFYGIATELERLAYDYDNDAASIEAIGPDGQSPATRRSSAG
jgi:hypothetical protein